MAECLLFDCDGTLVDSERLCNIGLVRKFNEFNIMLDADELVLRFRGWKLALILEILAAEHNVNLPEDFIASYRSIVSDLFEKELKPVDGVVYALENLPQDKAVVSSGPLHKIQQALRVTKLDKYFGDNLYSSYEVGIWKPDPGIYEHAAKHMGSSRSECIAIDDGPVGVEAACRARIKTLFFNHFNESCDFSEAISFNSFADLPALINP